MSTAATVAAAAAAAAAAANAAATAAANAAEVAAAAAAAADAEMSRLMPLSIPPVPGYTTLPGSLWLESNRSTLPQNEWVAADDSGLCGTSPSIGALIDELHDRHIDLSRVVIAYNTLVSA